jgi:hypothetical protein
MRLKLVLACAVPLAACSSEPDVDMKNASVEEVVDEVAKAGGSDVLLRPGKWQTKVTVQDISIPGMPPEAQAQMKQMFTRQQNVTVDHCVTPEQAKKPGGDFFTGKKAENCRYDRFTMSGGKVDGVMRCTGDQSTEMRMTMSGTYTAESSTAQTEMVVSGGQGGMTMKARSEAKRIGDCDGTEKS